VSYDYLL